MVSSFKSVFLIKTADHDDYVDNKSEHLTDYQIYSIGHRLLYHKIVLGLARDYMLEWSWTMSFSESVRLRGIASEYMKDRKMNLKMEFIIQGA